MTPIVVERNESSYPVELKKRLGDDAPRQLAALGNLKILLNSKTTLFCSSRAPGDVILRTHDLAARWREEGRCVISGFHSTIERECLHILLRGRQSIIICLARSLEGMRFPAEWKQPVADNRLLILSCFDRQHRRVTADLAARRNEFVAALADEIVFAHITPGGSLERLARQVDTWGISRSYERSWRRELSREPEQADNQSSGWRNTPNGIGGTT